MQTIIFIGLQASGKSMFFLERFYSTHIRLNMDMLKTRHRENILFNACLEAKQPVVIDNTNPTREERKKYIDACKKAKFLVIGYYFQSKIEECLLRNNNRIGKEKIPDVGLRGTYKKLQPPTYEEGFDELYYVSISDNQFLVSEWKSEI